MGYCGQPDTPICRGPVRDYFPELDEGAAATVQHDECWVGMDETDDVGVGPDQRGQGCEAGCIPVRDLPAEMASCHAPTDGRRWLRPHPTDLSLHADGIRRPLRAGRVNLLPAYTTSFQVAPCFDNDGLECFGESSCFCFGSNSGKSNITADPGGPTEAHCFPSAGQRWYARGLFPNEFIYQGIDWPPQFSGGFGIVAGGLHCRKFQRQNAQAGTIANEDLTVRMNPGEMLSPSYVRDMVRDTPAAFDNHHVPNAMISAVGSPLPSNCTTSFYESSQFSDPPGPPPDWFNSSANRLGFARIAISGDPHFRTDSAMDGLNDADILSTDLKTKVLQFALSHSFPKADGGAIDFHQLDHEFAYAVRNNANANTWSRQWDASDEGVGQDGAVDDLPTVPLERSIEARIYGIDPDRDDGAFDLDLVVTRVAARLFLLPLQMRDRRLTPIRPILRFQVRVKIRVELNVRWPVAFSDARIYRGSWLGPDHPEYDQRDALFARIEIPGRLGLAEKTRNGHLIDIVYRDRESKAPIIIPKAVEWLGYMGEVGQNQSQSYPYAIIDSAAVAGSVLDIVRGNHPTYGAFQVGGWPMALTTVPDDASQIHGGKLALDFVS